LKIARQIVALLIGCAFLISAWSDSDASKTAALRTASPAAQEEFQVPSSSPCFAALSGGFICSAANDEAARLLRAHGFAGAVVVEDARSGALVAFASASAVDARAGGEILNSALGVTSAILPLSTSKVFLAASWWDHEAEAAASKTCKSRQCMTDAEVREMLVTGSDSEGKRLALELRQAIGGERVLADLNGYGIPAGVSNRNSLDAHFWGAIDPELREKLTPASAYASVAQDTPDNDWASAFSIGETGFSVTLLHISRFLQAVGNGGLMVAPVARVHAGTTRGDRDGVGKRVMQASTAKRLQSALIDNVERGTASGIRGRMGNTWRIGGKTGTNSDPDGIFAGLVFDAAGVARYAFATYIKRGGRGGGVAAEVSADVMRFIVGN
jgi:cell division protein FtsI/penicillin-binding protein 2